MSEIRIYVASLADYNAGNLHGKWIDATLGEDHIREEINQILRTSKHPNIMIDCPECDGAGDPCCDTCRGRKRIPSAEEWAIHDQEGFEGIRLSESESIETVALHAEMLEKHGEAWAVYVEWVGGEPSESDFEEKYIGEMSAEDYAEEVTEDCMEVPESLKYYIDYKSMARDMEINGDVYEEKGHLFRGY